MLIRELGEFGLIDRIKRAVSTDKTVIKGIGDDCAVIKYSRDKYLLLSCDMLVEGVDFTKKTSPGLIGRKALAVSISDIAACCGVPRYALVSLGMPKNTTVKFVDGILRGIQKLAEEYKVNIVGGDLSRADKIVVDVSITGLVEKKRLALRNTAKPGDWVFVSGKLGGSIRGKHLKFTPRVKEARFLSGSYKISSMIDISDGLLQDLGHILKESNVGAEIYEESIPLSKQSKSLFEALGMGEDFELLFTLPRGQGLKLKRLRKGYSHIGNIVEKKYGLQLIDRYGKRKKPSLGGFKHF